MGSISLVRGENLSSSQSLQLGSSTSQTHNAQFCLSFCTIRVPAGGIVVAVADYLAIPLSHNVHPWVNDCT
jgi:hypothetical protein